jgi:VIT1/CCC1 family predicted Fe2+/Mn2+ transporter
MNLEKGINRLFIGLGIVSGGIIGLIATFSIFRSLEGIIWSIIIAVISGFAVFGIGRLIIWILKGFKAKTS